MIKIILYIVVSQIYGAFLQDEYYLYTTTERNEDWSSKSMSSTTSMNRLSKYEKYRMWLDCYHNAFFIDTNMTRSKIFTCLDLFHEGFQVLDVILANRSSEEFSINTTYLKALAKRGDLLGFEILQFFFKLIPQPVLAEIFEDMVDIVSDAINRNTFSYRFCKMFIDFLLKLNTIDAHLVVNKPKLVVAVWHPFVSNFTGIRWIKTVNDTVGGQIEKINCTSYYGLSHQFNVNHTEMTACVHPSFLKELAITLNEEDKKKLYVVLILSFDNLSFAKYLYDIKYDIQLDSIKDNRVVGFSMPGYCKQIYQPLLNISFDGISHHFFGKLYFDLSYVWHKHCSLSKMLFVDRVRTVQDTMVYHESVRYCLEETTMQGLHKLRWTQTPIYEDVYPDSFCVGDNYKIPSRKCSRSGFVNYSHIECLQSSKRSSYSEILYRFATKCNQFKNFTKILRHFNSFDLVSKLDQHLYLMAIECISRNILICNTFFWCRILIPQIEENLDVIHATLNRGIEIAHKLNRGDIILSFILRFIEVTQLIRTRDGIEIYPRYIYYKQTKPSVKNLTKIVMYKRDGNFFANYRAKVSMSEDMLIDTSDTKLEVIIIANFSFFNAITPITILVLYDDLFPTLEGFIRKSRTVILYSASLNVETKLYLKIINFDDKHAMISYTGEGYWVSNFFPVITSDPIPPALKSYTAIYEEHDDYCVGEKFALTKYFYHFDADTYEGNMNSKKLLQKSIDLLSAISFSINTADTISEIELIYQKYMFIFYIFRLTGGPLSGMGIFFLFTTTFMLKGWYKTKFNVIQLTTTLAIQLPFFLLDMEVSHVKILFFYYCILCQFSCTSIIGYVQYTKYVAVFKNRTIGRLKCLVMGWVVPAIIILISLFFYGGCLKCHLCHKNKEIFMFFVFVPIVTIIVGNSLVYVVAMINIWSAPKLSSHDIKLRIKVTFFLPCVLGITWIFIIALVAPWSWSTLMGLFLIHLVLPSQGFVLFVFVILLDRVTRDQWKNYLKSIRRNGTNSAIELN